jgi:basic membrane protein A
MKVYRVLVLFTILALALVACNSSAPQVNATPTTQPEPPVAAAKPFRVAVILPSAINDLAFSQSMYDALKRLQEEMGGAEKMQYVYSQGMFIIDDAAAAIHTYASQDYDLVIAHGSQYGKAIQEIAPAFPQVSFMWTNATEPLKLPNVFEVIAAAHEGGYVNGVLAATLTSNKIIGIVGPVEAGEPKQYVEGFKAGVMATDPEIQLNVRYIGSFSDVVKASETAANFISSGADILTGTAQMVVGPIGTANQNNVLWFGTQSDQSPLAPKIVVTSQVYHWEVALKEVVAKVQADMPGGEILTINLSNGGEVIEYNPDYALPANAKALGDATIAGIIDGSITISRP